MAKPIAPDLVYHLTLPSSPSLSPDAARVVFVRSKVDREAMRSTSHLVLLQLADGHVVPFTQGPNDTSPRFSPDGLTIAFLRSVEKGRPDAKERPQLWLIPVAGGEARQLTRVPGGVGEFAWSPDSQALAFVSEVDPDRPPEGHDPVKDPRVRVVRRIRYRADTLGRLGDAHRHLFVVDILDTEVRQLTFGDGEDMGPVWSPDGSRIAYVSDRRTDRDMVSYADAYVVPAEGGTAQQWSQGLVSVARVEWAPDGQRLAAIGSQDPEIVPGWQGWVFVLELGKAPRCLTDDSVNPAGGFVPIALPPPFRWGENGQIVFIGDRHGQSYLCSVPASGGALRMVCGGNALFTTLSFDASSGASGQLAVVAATSPNSPGELYLADLAAGTQRQITNHNEEYLIEHPPARQEKFVFTRGGFDIECCLFLPPDHDPSRRYPLVVDVHGGPHGVFMDTFNNTQHVLATAGYMVLCPNPRGSATYGAQFAKAVLRSWGDDDYEDIMAAVEHVCTRPDVDASRLGVHGYSYGGYMACWSVGHTNRFRAAVAGAPVTDLPALYYTSDIGVPFGEVQWGGLPHVGAEEWRSHSPITYAEHVATPLLLMHGEADHRVPIEQSEVFFTALKRQGKEVEFVRFPGCYHSFLRYGHPRMREEYLARTLAWFDQHLRGE